MAPDDVARPPAVLRWRPRRVPRPVAGVAACGPQRDALLRRLLELPDEHLDRLRVAAGGEVAIVLGAPDDVPWVDGGEWLGTDPDAPGLLLPTALDPSWPLDLLQARVIGARGVRSGAVAMLVDGRRLIATGAATRPDLDVVRRALSARDAGGAR